MDRRISREADLNLIESAKTRAEVVKGGDVVENSKYVFFTIGIDSEDGHLNGMVCLDDDSAKEAFEEALDYFGKLNRNFSIWVRGDENRKLETLLLEKGYTPKRKPGSAVMAIFDRLEGNALKEGYRLEKIENKSQIKDLAVVVSEAFDKDKAVSDHMFSELKTASSEKTASYLIYKGDVPVASSITVVSGDTAGIYWIGVREEYRREGLGAYIVQTATNEGFERGAKAVILQASQVGEYLYEKLGYEPIKHYRLYTIEV